MCHNGALRQSLLYSIRCVNRDEVIAIVFYMEYIDPHHVAVVGDSAADRNIQIGLDADFDLIHDRTGSTVPLGLMEWLGKGLVAFSTELFQPFFQGFIERRSLPAL